MFRYTQSYNNVLLVYMLYMRTFVYVVCVVRFNKGKGAHIGSFIIIHAVNLWKKLFLSICSLHEQFWPQLFLSLMHAKPTWQRCLNNTTQFYGTLLCNSHFTGLMYFVRDTIARKHKINIFKGKFFFISIFCTFCFS